MTYYKLNNGVLSQMPAPKNISNPTDEQLSDYAAAKGYKKLRITEATTAYHTMSYREYDDYITTVWTKPSLASLQATLAAEAEAAKEAALNSSTTLTVEDVGDVLWDTQASINLLALAGTDLSALDVPYILADDTVINISNEQVAAISTAFMAHVQGIYNAKTARLTAIEAAETVEVLLYPDSADTSDSVTEE